MIPRYQTESMKELWSDAHKYKTWYLVELAYLDAYLSHQGSEDVQLINSLNAKADTLDWVQFANTVNRYDQEVKHDVIAFLHVLEDELKQQARLIHSGLTSSDIVDTAFSLLLKDAGKLILEKLKEVIIALWRRATEFRGLIMLGRTHGQAAEPTTFGIKLLSHMCELIRSYQRLTAAKEEISVGKFSGAVGIYAHTHPAIEHEALQKLGLFSETVATQVIARDRHAAFFASLAILAGTIERMAVEFRLLMHGQIQEACEPFSHQQKGSSAMPHKKNPVLSENLSGLMRLMRSYAQAAFENQALWHERDISHSSVERMIAPDATGLMDFALVRLKDLVDGLVVNKKNIQINLEKAKDIVPSQSILNALINKGLMRQKAYKLVQTAALQPHLSFKEGLINAHILEFLTENELNDLMNKSLAVSHEGILFERAKTLLDEI